MTFPTDAKAFHFSQLKVRNVKRIPFDNQFKILVCDVMKAYYAIYAKDTWAEVATSFINRYVKMAHRTKHTFLILVADLYKVKNMYRMLVSTTRTEARLNCKSRKRKFEEIEEIEEEQLVKVELPSTSDHEDTPPSELRACIYNHKWKLFILKKIGEEIRKKKLPNITIVTRGLCEEPEFDSETYDKKISNGMVWVVPCEEDDRKPFQSTIFDKISCPSTSEADCATLSMAGAISDHHDRILPHLCRAYSYPADRIPNILIVTGDGDAHTISMMFCLRRNLENIYVVVVEVDWVPEVMYNCHEAATALGDPKTGFRSIYIYCAMIYFAGCDYVKKISNLSTGDLSSKINSFMNSKDLGDKVFNKPSPLNEYRSFARPDFSLEGLVKLVGGEKTPFFSHLGWMAFIAHAAGVKIASCKCDRKTPSLCSNLFKSRATEGVASGSNSHITLHQLMTTTAGMESTIQYFVAETDHQVNFYPCQEIDDMSGYFQDDQGVVRFGMLPLSEDFVPALIHFLNIDPETISLM